MTEKLDIIKKRYDEINEELLKPENISDYYKQKELLKEKSNLSPLVEEYHNFINLNNEIRDLKILIDDIELGEYAKSELDIKNEMINKIRNNIELLLIPKDENDGKDIIMEIRGAAGGDEANIFAADLFRMYSKYAETQKWIIEINDIIENQNGGFSKIDLIIRGNNVYSKLKFESGVHRVQRVPQTESQGRVHTSTATVLVMPEINDIDVDIKPDDIRIDVYRSSGKGGQGVNTTDSAVRITHLPTNIVVTCQKERSQIKNKDRAMRVLKSKIYDLKLQKQITENESKRLSKIGTGDRSEKIRTYNYPQNRITDHRINYSIMELDKVIDGNLDPLIDFLTSEDQKRKMELSI